MKTFAQKIVSLIGAFVTVAAVFIAPVSAYADTWRGTAPVCRGKCLKGETQISISSDGDGGHCFSGHKVLCRNTQPLCPFRETETHCAGVVMICDNGFHESPTGNWHSCGSYACGACLGISAINPLGSDTCKQGFVWREAIDNDHVCVTPATRTQAGKDNAAAAGRRAGGGASGPDTCKPGFVWREVVPTDHVCVTPATRTTAAADNNVALQRRAGN